MRGNDEGNDERHEIPSRKEKAQRMLRKEWERLVNINTPPVRHLIKELPVKPQHEQLQKEILDELHKIQREIADTANRVNYIAIGVDSLKLVK